MKVRDILRRKGNKVISVLPDSTVLEALRLMAQHNLGGVLVMENDKLLGIFTERDYARKIVLQGRSSSESKLKEVMVSKLVTVAPEDELSSCMKLMTDKLIRHLPVLENDQLVGIISIGDVVKSIIEEQQTTIEHLEGYISR